MTVIQHRMHCRKKAIVSYWGTGLDRCQKSQFSMFHLSFNSIISQYTELCTKCTLTQVCVCYRSAVHAENAWRWRCRCCRWIWNVCRRWCRCINIFRAIRMLLLFLLIILAQIIQCNFKSTCIIFLFSCCLQIYKNNCVKIGLRWSRFENKKFNYLCWCRKQKTWCGCL